MSAEEVLSPRRRRRKFGPVRLRVLRVLLIASSSPTVGDTRRRAARGRESKNRWTNKADKVSIGRVGATPSRGHAFSGTSVRSDTYVVPRVEELPLEPIDGFAPDGSASAITWVWSANSALSYRERSRVPRTSGHRNAEFRESGDTIVTSS